jgi:hypothetical protein
MNPKNLRDLDASISILSGSLKAYFAGDPYAYFALPPEVRSR